MLKILTIAIALLFSGCVTDGVYNVGKTVYIGGKAVVIANADLLPQDTLDKLDRVDDMAIRYDETRSIVKNTTNGEKDVNSTK